MRRLSEQRGAGGLRLQRQSANAADNFVCPCGDRHRSREERRIALQTRDFSNVAAGGSGDQAHAERATRGRSQRNTCHRGPECQDGNLSKHFITKRCEHISRTQQTDLLRNALALVLNQTRPEMRFASCERVSGEKRDSAAGSDKTRLCWSHASWRSSNEGRPACSCPAILARIMSVGIGPN
jgi:hypothetical protein